MDYFEGLFSTWESKFHCQERTSPPIASQTDSNLCQAACKATVFVFFLYWIGVNISQFIMLSCASPKSESYTSSSSFHCAAQIQAWGPNPPCRLRTEILFAPIWIICHPKKAETFESWPGLPFWVGLIRTEPHERNIGEEKSGSLLQRGGQLKSDQVEQDL